MERLDYNNLKDFLTTEYIGRNIVYLDSTTSTNDVAKDLAQYGYDEGLVVVAEEQTKGRGRLGRRWSTHKGEAIAASILLKPDIKIPLANSITHLIGLSAAKALINVTGFDILIKWPNDLVLNKKKLCGILTEMGVEGTKIKYIIAGIGININQNSFEEDINNIAISLKSYSNNYFDRRIILSQILNQFEKDYENFKRYGLKYFIDDLKRYSIVLGKEVIILDKDEVIKGTAIDIDEKGYLILKDENGQLKSILNGDLLIEGLYNIYTNQ